jgi:hypothetical protein
MENRKVDRKQLYNFSKTGLKNFRLFAGYFWFLTGSLLLGISFLGNWGDFGGYENRPKRDWERYDQALMERTPNMDALLIEAQQRSGLFNTLSRTEIMDALYGVIASRFTHGPGAHHNLFTNWILWMLGVFHPALGNMWDPDIYVRNGHSVNCGQASYALLELALKSGITARHVGLNGHVVMEAWYDNDWHLYDPDLEVVPRDSQGAVLSVEELAQDQEMLAASYTGVKKKQYRLLHHAKTTLTCPTRWELNSNGRASFSHTLKKSWKFSSMSSPVFL